MAQTFAIAPATVPDADYLTGGKAYPVLKQGAGGLFTILSDDGERIDCLQDGCAHLDGLPWTLSKSEPLP